MLSEKKLHIKGYALYEHLYQIYILYVPLYEMSRIGKSKDIYKVD